MADKPTKMYPKYIDGSTLFEVASSHCPPLREGEKLQPWNDAPASTKELRVTVDLAKPGEDKTVVHDTTGAQYEKPLPEITPRAKQEAEMLASAVPASAFEAGIKTRMSMPPSPAMGPSTTAQQRPKPAPMETVTQSLSAMKVERGQKFRHKKKKVKVVVVEANASVDKKGNICHRVMKIGGTRGWLAKEKNLEPL